MSAMIPGTYKKFIGIGELFLSFVLMVLIIICCSSYWANIRIYENTFCMEIIFENSSEKEKTSRMSEICQFTNPQLVDKLNINNDNTKKCKYFLMEDIDPPNSGGVQGSIILAVLLMIIGFLGRAFGHIFLTYSRNIHEKKMIKFDFWSINIMMLILSCTLIGIAPALMFKYTETCIESRDPQYDTQYYYSYSSLYFWLMIAILTIYNGAWISIILGGVLCKRANFPQVYYFMLNNIIFLVVVACLLTLCYEGGIGLATVFVFLVWVTVYSIYIWIFIKDYDVESHVEEPALIHGLSNSRGNQQNGGNTLSPVERPGNPNQEESLRIDSLDDLELAKIKALDVNRFKK